MEQMSGRVFVTGSEPDVSITLVPPQGPGVMLVGGLRGELGHLSGATVRVRGKLATASRPKTLTVDSYDVLEIDGEVPKVGTILVEGDALKLAGRDTVELANPPEELGRKAGAKVWIVGQPSGEKLVVQSYGLIREASQ
jgi:hypothetical protein